MKTLTIVAGILLVLWLGFMALDRNKVNDEITNHNQRLLQLEGQHDEMYERYELENGNEGNKNDKTEQNLDKQEDEYDKKIEMPYENKNTNENTDLKNQINPNDNQNGENNRAGKVKKPNPAKANEPEANANESIVAYSQVKYGLYEPATEAFKLNLFEIAFLGEDSVTAFQLK